jgi:hypothetical protein
MYFSALLVLSSGIVLILQFFELNFCSLERGQKKKKIEKKKKATALGLPGLLCPSKNEFKGESSYIMCPLCIGSILLYEKATLPIPFSHESLQFSCRFMRDPGSVSDLPSWSPLLLFT